MLTVYLLATIAHGQAVLSVPQPYATVRLAVVASAPGDIVEVDGDLYHRVSDGTLPVLIKHDLTIRGKNTDPLLPRLAVSSAKLVVEEALIQGVGVVDAEYGSDYGIVVVSGALHMDDVGLLPTKGPGVLAYSSELFLERVTGSGFGTANRVISAVGGAIDVSDSDFSYNSGGAIAALDAGITIAGCTFAGNSADSGADVFVANGQLLPLTITDSTSSFAQALFTAGGSVAAFGGVDVHIEGSTFEDAAAADVGGAVVLASDGYTVGSLHIVDSVFERAFSPLGGGAVALGGGTGTIERSTFLACSAGLAGGAIGVSGAELLVDESYFEGSSALSGGAIYAGDDPYLGLYGTSLTIEDSEIVGGSLFGDAGVGGGISIAAGADAAVLRTSISDTSVWNSGGAVYVENAELLLEGLVVERAAALLGGAVAAQDSALRVVFSSLSSNEADYGSAIYTIRGDSTVEDTLVSANVAAVGGAVLFDDPGAVGVRRNTFCANVDPTSGAVLLISQGSGGPFTVQNNVFNGNGAGPGGTVTYDWADALDAPPPVLELRNNTLVGNHAAYGVLSSGGAVDIRSNIVQGHAVGLASDLTLVSGGYNLWYDNGIDTLGTPDLPGEGAVFADPLYQGYTPDDCASNLWLTAGSPARDAGDPAWSDEDGSPSDIGAYGGPESPLNDADGDGVFEDLDCDDAAIGIAPGAAETPYDGIDQDCDGADLCDVDGDGVLHPLCGGTDCLDTRADVYPGADDPPDDDVDANCDGFEGKTWIAGGGGCAVAPSGRVSWILVLALLASRRLRTRSARR